eukprot:1522241-Prymnesium_polylepis.1
MSRTYVIRAVHASRVLSIVSRTPDPSHEMPGFKSIAVAALNASRKQAAKHIANGFLGDCCAAAAMGKFKATVEVTVKYDATILPAMAEHDYVKEAVIREIRARVASDVRDLSIDIDYNHENKEIPEALKATLQGRWAPSE